jgi:glucan 1,3-beta-glucosidase
MQLMVIVPSFFRFCSAALLLKCVTAGALNGPARTSNSMGTTGQPAVVYIPSGTYLMTGSLQLYVGTVIMGDALNRPILKASSSFSNDHIIYGKDPNQGGTVNFYIALKNVIIDSTSVPTSNTVALLDWTVSQGTQLTNVIFNMPDYSSHTGLTTQYDYNSNTILVSYIVWLFVQFNINIRMNTRMILLSMVVPSG